MEGSDKLLVGEDKNTYNISSVWYNHTGLYLCEASNMLGILSNSTPASLTGENDFVFHCIPKFFTALINTNICIYKKIKNFQLE